MLSLTWRTTSTQQMPAGSTDAPGAPFRSHTKNARAVASSINAMCKRTRPKRARAHTHMPAHLEPERCSRQADYEVLSCSVFTDTDIA